MSKSYNFFEYNVFYPDDVLHVRGARKIHNIYVYLDVSTSY